MEKTLSTSVITSRQAPGNQGRSWNSNRCSLGMGPTVEVQMVEGADSSCGVLSEATDHCDKPTLNQQGAQNWRENLATGLRREYTRLAGQPTPGDPSPHRWQQHAAGEARWP